MSLEIRAVLARDYGNTPIRCEPGFRNALIAIAESARVAPLRILVRPTMLALGDGLSVSGAVVAASRQLARAIPAIATAIVRTRMRARRATRDAGVEIGTGNDMRDPSSAKM
jgi:hypothetical protein